MEWTKVTVDVPKLAAGLYEMFDDDMLGVLSFGMLPAPLMGLFSSGLGEKFDEMQAERKAELIATIESHPVFAEVLADELPLLEAHKKKWMRETEHSVCREIYRLHSNAGRMVV